MRHVQVHEQDIEGAALDEVERFLTATAEGHLVAFVPEHLGATLAQQILIVHDEDADARLSFRGNRFPHRRGAGVAGDTGRAVSAGPTVSCRREKHGGMSRNQGAFHGAISMREDGQRASKSNIRHADTMRLRAQPHHRRRDRDDSDFWYRPGGRSRQAGLVGIDAYAIQQ